MKKFVYDAWNHIMNAKVNPLKHIPDLQVRHMVMQVLAFMWSGVFALYIANSILAFGIRAIAHMLLVAAVVVTVGTFKIAETKPQSFEFIRGYHTYGRGRGMIIWRDKFGNPIKKKLPPNDPGGEHE